MGGRRDTLLELERPSENAPPTQRLLLALSRYPGTPAAALIDHDPNTGSWTVTGHAEDRRSARLAGLRSRVLIALGDDELTRPELEDATGVAWRDLIEAVNALIADKQVTRSGEGRRGDPYRYRKAVGRPGPQNRTPPTESPGGGALVSVVCPVGTPQKEAPPSSEAVAVGSHRNGNGYAAATDDEQERYERALRLVGDTSGDAWSQRA